MTYLEKLIQKAFDMLVPVGTVIFVMSSEVPEGYIMFSNVKIYEDEFPRLYAVLANVTPLSKGTDSGRNWVELPDIDGRVLQATTDVTTVGQLLEASLPNIIGKASSTGTSCFNGFSGAFYDDGDAIYMTESFGTLTALPIGLDASLSNELYGGMTLQPSAVQALPLIKT